MCGSGVERESITSQHRSADKVGPADSMCVIALEIAHVVDGVHGELLAAGMALASSVDG